MLTIGNCSELVGAQGSSSQGTWRVGIEGERQWVSVHPSRNGLKVIDELKICPSNLRNYNMGRNSLFKTVFNAAAAADAQVVRAALDISPPFDIGRNLFAPKYLRSKFACRSDSAIQRFSVNSDAR